jgi:hypothetical protein
VPLEEEEAEPEKRNSLREAVAAAKKTKKGLIYDFH